MWNLFKNCKQSRSSVWTSLHFSALWTEINVSVSRMSGFLWFFKCSLIKLISFVYVKNFKFSVEHSRSFETKKWKFCGHHNATGDEQKGILQLEKNMCLPQVIFFSSFIKNHVYLLHIWISKIVLFVWIL